MSYMKRALEEDTYEFIKALAKLTDYDFKFLDDRFWEATMEDEKEWFEALMDITEISMEHDW